MQHWTRQAKLLIITLTVMTLALLLGPVAPAWTSPLQHPNRQTVPMTPPATWTPVVQPGIGVATDEPRPTALPTLQLKDKDGSDSSESTGQLGGTPKSEERTAEPAMAVPWFEMTADSTMIEPGQTVVVRAVLANLGNAPLAATTVRIAMPAGLENQKVAALYGTAKAANTGEIVWETPELAPGGQGVCEVSCNTSTTLWPGTIHVIGAQAEIPETQPAVQQIELIAPMAILAQAGQP